MSNLDMTPPPTKPPRGVKTSKETSGLLMCVIRTLATSESNEQREREKAKLEREYTKSDQQLNELVSLYKQDLTTIMQLFGKISTVITNTREKLHGIKEILIACKTLLSCRRDELKKLWLEGVEHKHVLKLLEEIEQLKDVPSKLAVHLANREYLQGTQLLVAALNIGNGALEGVEALRELKNELYGKKTKLYEQLLLEILHVVYFEPTKELNTFVRDSGSMRGKSKWRRKFLDSSSKSSLSNNESVGDEMSFENELGKLVECLALLNMLPEALDNIKMRMQSEILDVVGRVTKAVVTHSKEGVHPLVDLLDTLTQQLRKVASRHESLCNSFLKAAKVHKISCITLQRSDIWSTIQAVLQLLLTDYLDIQNTANESQQSPAYQDHIGDISFYFARRKLQRTRKLPLFKFEYSSHNKATDDLENSSTLSRLSDGSKERDKLLVCMPDPFNITVIYTPLQNFIEEIEESTGMTNGVPCTLNTFVNDYVKDVFIGRVQSRILLKIETATKSSDAWRAATTPQIATEMGLFRPLLLSTVQVSDSIRELELLLDCLPHHKIQILEILVGLIRGYTETCYAAYRGIVQPEPEDKRLCSAAWLKDEDINRFLKSLPNWTDLQAQKSQHRSGRPLKREDTTEEESPEDVRQRNIKEAEILASNLGEGGVSQQEIISDPMQLKCLAQLQESMEWFAWRVSQITFRLKKSISTSASDITSHNLSDYVVTLGNLSQEFEELANTCLLVLHLEVRVQCFHYLMPRGNQISKQKGMSQDPDPRVLDLSRVLVSLDEVLSSSLQTRKTKYIFEGLGQLIAKILMSTMQYMERIDESAVHKMCRNVFTLQQTLTNITMAREVALDHARTYFHLFFLKPEDILNEVLEKGAEYTELEYMNALQLICRTYDSEDENSTQRYLQKLSDILGEVGVTV
ncbi:exocyst complex component secretory 8 [Rhodnius prolixus]|uniref:exocyst complex component secretory 8 n=1 Tax=Rhodnius prolixus TaxID=13249 RepID=UPI003D18C072